MLDNVVYFAVAIAASPNLHDVNQVFGALTNGILIAFIGGSALAWLLCLVDTARRHRRGWLALVLVPPLLAGGAAYPLGLTTGDGGAERAALLFALVAAILSLLCAAVALRRPGADARPLSLGGQTG